MTMAKLKIGTLVDRLYKQNQVIKEKQRLVSKAEAAVDKEKTKATRIENEIFDRFDKEKIKGAFGKVAKVEVKTVVGVQLNDWKKVTAYIKRTGRFSLFQRRINKAAWLEELESRKQRPVPGLKTYEAVKLSITKK